MRTAGRKNPNETILRPSLLPNYVAWILSEVKSQLLESKVGVFDYYIAKAIIPRARSGQEVRGTVVGKANLVRVTRVRLP